MMVSTIPHEGVPKGTPEVTRMMASVHVYVDAAQAFPRNQGGGLAEVRIALTLEQAAVLAERLRAASR